MPNAVVQTSPARAPFDAVADVYDETFTFSLIGRAQLDAVTRELDRVFHPGQRILEINCGTGIDALHLAGRGIEVLACDSSSRMIEVARRKAQRAFLNVPPQFRVIATEEIEILGDQEGVAAFDGAFSNFAGLNCVEDLPRAARGLARLLKPGAPALLCFFGRFCAWETAWYLARLKPRKAFRRLRPGGDLAQLAPGAVVRVHYPGVRALARIFAPHFRLRRWKGIGVALPPTYLENAVGRFPRSVRALARIDTWLSRCPLARGMGDHVLLEFRRSER
jgi:ubiquinone/menaquinone biosynthesis C-methylase UbiE